LKKDHGLSSVEEASKKVLTLEANRASVEKNIIDKYTTLKEKYEW
jgi:2-C-methyl-D-erythritol 4-phosphate cytidylyltransferase